MSGGFPSGGGGTQIKTHSSKRKSNKISSHPQAEGALLGNFMDEFDKFEEQFENQQVEDKRAPVVVSEVGQSVKRSPDGKRKEAINTEFNLKMADF